MKTKLKIKSAILGLLLMLACPTYAQTKVILSYSDNTEETIILSDTGKLYFLSDNLMVDEGNGSLTSISLNSIQRVSFKSLTDNIIESNSNQNLSMKLYPNPANDFIRITNISETVVTVYVYSIVGNLVLKQSYIPDEIIDISRLSKGLYIIKINQQIIKFSKL